MRNLALLGLVLAASGCDFDSWTMSYQSTLYQDAEGVAFRSDGSGAQVGMMGTTCAIDPISAAAGADYDYPGSDESVADAGSTPNGDVVVVTSDKGVHIQRDDSFWGAASEDYEMDGVVAAGFVETGAVALRDDVGKCSVEWVGDTVDSTAVDDALCEAESGFTVDPTTGVVYVGTDSGIHVVTPGVAQELDPEPSEIVEWDPVVQVLYAAELHGNTVRALASDGSVVWSTQLEGAILGLDDMGVRAAVAVNLEKADGTGSVAILDGYTGSQMSGVDTPQPAQSIHGGGDGRHVALVQHGEVHFYAVGATMYAPEGDAGEWDVGDDWNWDIGY